MLVRAAAALLTGLAFLPAQAAEPRTGAPAVGGRLGSDVSVESAALLVLEPGSTEVLRTQKPARTVVVGDPSIVEASVLNENTILLVPRAAGFTNLILLDEQGNTFYRRTVRVGTPSRPIIVHRGEGVQTYLCAPTCDLPPEPSRQPSAGETIVGGSPGNVPAAPGGGAAALPPGLPPGATAPARPGTGGRP